jgi:hypothetical protein
VVIVLTSREFFFPQPLARLDGESYCPDCTSFRPNRPTFDAWMAAVDAALVRKCGVNSSDLPDVCYRDRYDTGSTPEEAADEAIKNSMNSTRQPACRRAPGEFRLAGAAGVNGS